MRERNKLRRRVFLGALGLGLGVPFARRAADLALAAPGDRPTRLLIFYVPHGVPIEHFDPIDGTGNLALGASGIGVLSPLQPFASQVLAIRGLRMAEGASNHAAIRTVLTGSTDGATDSIDFVIAQALGTQPHALGVIPYRPTAGYGSDSNLIRHGSWVRPTESPVDAASAMLGGIAEGGAAGPNPDVAFRERAMLLTESQLGVLHTELNGLTSEQNKLSLHLESLRSLKAASTGGGDFEVSCDAVAALPAVEAMRGKDATDPVNFGTILDGHLEVSAQALTCGSARVVTVQNLFGNANINMGFAGGPGVAKEHHDPISHSWDEVGRAEFAAVQSWFYERLATKLLTPLNQPDPADPAHTVLDNTIVLVCSEVSDGANHNSDASAVWLGGKEHKNYLPFVLIGGGGGVLNPGRVVNVERSQADLLATIAYAMGVSVTQLGSTAVQPIQEVLL